jgi:hypothetical protein
MFVQNAVEKVVILRGITVQFGFGIQDARILVIAMEL